MSDTVHTTGDIAVHAVGDVFLNRDDPSEPFSLVKDVLDAADVVFGNCEAPFGGEAQTRGISLIAEAGSAAGLKAAGFTMMSCANNHILDAGSHSMLGTLNILHGVGIATAGAGPNLAEARRPARVVVDGGATVAMVAYACYFRRGDEATPDRSGIVTVGGETVELIPPDLMCSPGVAPPVASVPNGVEVDAMMSDIAEAKREADVVLASFHWGDATRPTVLTDHEWRTARSAIDAGADVVVGHHHHVLRGVEVYRGKPIFYGLGNFIWDAPPGWPQTPSAPGRETAPVRFEKYGLRPRLGYPHLPFHPDGRMTVICRCRFRGSELRWFGFLPCLIDPDARVRPLEVTSEAGREVIGFIQDTCDDLQLPVSLEPDPDERVGPFIGVRVVPRRG
jgi:poly-gamma-glutamate capsule biosynthesis protein CapA/YwtB (metallophosphatase superfamily)